MAITQSELGSRIATARSRRGLSQVELAEAVGLTQSAISRIESGERAVDSLELASLARHLGVSILDLLEDQPLPEEVLQGSARLEATRAPGAVDQGYQRLLYFLRFDQLLDNLGAPAFPRPAPPDIQLPSRGPAKDQGRALAVDVRKRLDLGDEPVPNLMELAEERLGLDIALEPLTSGLSGLCLRTDGIAAAIIDSSAAYARQRFTVAHEIAHHLMRDGDPLWVDEQLFGQGVKEIRANAFAAHFLMPQSGIERIVNRYDKIDPRVVLQLQYFFGVSLEALLWHLKNIGRISERSRQMYQGMGAKGLSFRYGYLSEWQIAEEQRDAVRPPSRLLRRTVHAYGAGLIGIERLGELLHRSDHEKLRRELEEAGITYEGNWPLDTVAG